MVSEQPYPTGDIMTNFDASVDRSKAATSFAIRDGFGSLLRVGGKLLPLPTVPFVELIATWLCVYVAYFEFHI